MPTSYRRGLLSARFHAQLRHCLPFVVLLPKPFFALARINKGVALRDDRARPFVVLVHVLAQSFLVALDGAFTLVFVSIGQMKHNM